MPKWMVLLPATLALTIKKVTKVFLEYPIFSEFFFLPHWFVTIRLACAWACKVAATKAWTRLESLTSGMIYRKFQIAFVISKVIVCLKLSSKLLAEFPQKSSKILLEISKILQKLSKNFRNFFKKFSFKSFLGWNLAVVRN